MRKSLSSLGVVWHFWVLSGTFGSLGIVWHFWLSGYCLMLLALQILSDAFGSPGIV